MFRSKKALVATLLTLTLLAAPAALASPGADAPLTWMSWIDEVVSDLYGFLGLAESPDLKSESTDDGTATTEEPVLTFESDPSGPDTMTQTNGDDSGTEMGPVAQPNG